jgi:RecA/RadA recombinase
MKAEKATDRFKNLKFITDKLNKRYGAEIVKTGDKVSPIIRVPYGEPILDEIYSGGVPVNRIVEKIGKEHSFKTVEGLKATANFQKFCFNCLKPTLHAEWEVVDGMPKLKKCKCDSCKDPKPTIQVIIDYEGTLSIEFIKNFGIDTNGIIYAKPESPSQLANFAEAYMKLDMVGIILIDSVGAMSSDDEVELPMEDLKMNRGALTLNKIMRKFTAALNYNSNRADGISPTTVFIINQSYSSLGIYSKEIPQGGRGLRHAKAISSKNRITDTIVDDKTKEVRGKYVMIKNEKNKTGMPELQAEIYINLDKSDPVGYCKSDIRQQYIEYAIRFGIIEKNGSWYSYGGEKWQGIDNIINNFPGALYSEVDEHLYGYNYSKLTGRI